MSVAGDVADAVKTALDALALTYGGNPVTTARRKVPVLPSGENPPQVVISVGEEGDLEYLTAIQNLNRYPVALTLVTAGGHQLADDEPLRLIRQRLRQTMDDKERATFAGVTGFNRVTTGGKAPFNAGALPKDLNYSTQIFTVEVIEAKAT